MTFETHTDTHLIETEEMPENFSQAWMPGWIADDYIREECPNIRENYRGTNHTNRYGYLYRMISAGLLVARKSDGFWFYSKESIDTLEKFDAIHTRIANSNHQQYQEVRRENKQKADGAQARIEEINETIHALSQEMSEKLKEIKSLKSKVKNMRPPKISRKLKKDLKEWENNDGISRRISAKWLGVGSFARNWKSEKVSEC